MTLGMAMVDDQIIGSATDRAWLLHECFVFGFSDSVRRTGFVHSNAIPVL